MLLYDGNILLSSLSNLTNFLNGHPAGPCPGIGDDSGGMGSDTNGALQAQGGVY